MSCGIKRIIKFNNAITSNPIKIIDNNEINITEKCMYSWSADNVCWSAWTSYDNYLRITIGTEKEMERLFEFLRTYLGK